MKRALYRQYRPNTFVDVVGQEVITTILSREMQSKTPSHAYLFVGPRGTGKTTCAKLIAKAVNCEHVVNGNPCNVCDNCKAVDEGSMTDVLEIDAASNNGVDDIRSLIEETAFTPTRGKYRVYIIDEVHMLSTSAFNALLKTLEEPPEHVIFILATTEVNKVLPTIISRCQRFDFKRIDNSIISSRLISVSKNENILLDDDAASLIASLSDGGMRDALSMLDICASNDNHVTYELVAKSVGLVGREHLFSLADSIINHNSKNALLKVNDLSKDGVDYPELTRQLAGHFRDLLISKISGTDILDYSKTEKAKVLQQANTISELELTKVISYLQESYSKIAQSNAKRLELELALVVLCGNSKAEKKIAEDIQPPVVEEIPLDISTSTLQEMPPTIENHSMIELECGAIKNWGDILSALRKVNPLTASLFGTTKAYFDGSHILLDIDNEFALEKLRSSDNTRKDIKKAIYQVLGKDYPIGPYKKKISETEEIKSKSDKLEELISSLPKDNNIIIS